MAYQRSEFELLLYCLRSSNVMNHSLDQVSAIWAQAHYGAKNNAVINSPSHSDAFNTLYNSANMTEGEDHYDSRREAVYNDYW